MHTALFMFDFYNNTIHLRFQISLLQYEKFIITTQDFPRVQLSVLAYTPAIRTNCGKFSLRYQGPLTWNSIDHNTKEINHRKIFKQKIKAQFVKTCI